MDNIYILIAKIELLLNLSYKDYVSKIIIFLSEIYNVKSKREKKTR